MMNILLANLMLILYLYSFCENVLKSKRIIGVELVLFLLFFWSSYLPCLWLRCIVVLFGIVVYVLLKYSDTLVYKLLMSIVFVGCMVVSEILCASLMHIVMGVCAKDYMIGEYTLLLVLEGVVFFALLYIVMKFIDLYKKDFLPQYTWMLLILPITSVMLLVNLEDYFLLFKQDLFVVLSVFGVLFANGFIFYMYFKVIEMYSFKEKMNRLEIKYSEILNMYDSSASFLHDVTNRLFHLNSMDEKLIKCGVNDLCGVLLQQFRNTQTRCLSLQTCLNNNYNRLLELKVQLRVAMNFVEFHSIQGIVEYDLFEVLLDYAISMCTVVEHPFIIFKSDLVNGCVVLKMQCSGSFQDSIVVNVSKFVPMYAKVFYEWKDNVSEVTIIFFGVCL